MIFVDDIHELQYYQNNGAMPCYCEQITNPRQIMLQAFLEYYGNNYYTALIDMKVTIDVYSNDGTIRYGTISSSDFTTYLFVGQNGYVYMNIQLVRIPALLCDNPCFILKVKLEDQDINKVVFDKYTEQYCTDGCCEDIGEISVED